PTPPSSARTRTACSWWRARPAPRRGRWPSPSTSSATCAHPCSARCSTTWTSSGTGGTAAGTGPTGGTTSTITARGAREGNAAQAGDGCRSHHAHAVPEGPPVVPLDAHADRRRRHGDAELGAVPPLRRVHPARAPVHGVHAE